MIRRWLAGGALCLAFGFPIAAEAQVGPVLRESFRTAGHAARDGARTAGRAVRALFRDGGDAAAATAREDGRATGADAKKNAARAPTGGRRAPGGTTLP